MGSRSMKCIRNGTGRSIGRSGLLMGYPAMAGVTHPGTCRTGESGAGSVRAIRCPGSDPGGCAERPGLRRGEACRMPVISRP